MPVQYFMLNRQWNLTNTALATANPFDQRASSTIGMLSLRGNSDGNPKWNNKIYSMKGLLTQTLGEMG